MAEYDRHAADYDSWTADVLDDVQWYVSLAREAAEPIVELAVGTGRVAIPVARETGKHVVGIDESGVLSLWWMTRSEQEGLCDVAGLEVEALYGGFHREPYDESAHEMVWIARKP